MGCHEKFCYIRTPDGQKHYYGVVIRKLLYKVSTTVMDLVVVFALFVFMLALLCFCACCYRIFGRIKIYILCCI